MYEFVGQQKNVETIDFFSYTFGRHAFADDSNTKCLINTIVDLHSRLCKYSSLCIPQVNVPECFLIKPEHKRTRPLERWTKCSSKIDCKWMDDIKIGPILPLSLQRRINRVIQIQDILNENHSPIEQNSPTSQKNVSFDFNLIWFHFHFDFVDISISRTRSH